MIEDYEKARIEIERIKRTYPWQFPEPSKLPDARQVVARAEAQKKESSVRSSRRRGGVGEPVRGKAKVAAAVPRIKVISPQLIAEEVDEADRYVEGATLRITINYFERDQAAREACIRKWGDRCSVCRFRFSEHYGRIGEGFIHVHHLKPLAEVRSRHTVDPLNDLRPVCPNCHAMLHKTNPAMSIEKLRKILIAEKRRRATRRRKTNASKGMRLRSGRARAVPAI